MLDIDGALHLVRFGAHNEQPYFKGQLQDTYQGLVFNANLVAWSSSGIAAYLLGSGLGEKPLFIDPLTHGFQHDPGALQNDEDEVKASVQQLIEAYGEPVIQTAGREATIPSDFNDDSVVESFVDNVIRFQRDVLHEAAQSTDNWPYVEFQYGGDFRLSPWLLVAPYFFMTESTFDRWIGVNVKMVQVAAGFVESPLAAEVVIAPDLLLGRAADLAERYGDAGADVVLLWIDEFSEHDQPKKLLRGLRDTAREFAKVGIEVINLYGGFFSFLLTHKSVSALRGVCHGPQYGEDRGVTPVGGGLPTARFYWRPMHQRLRFADALRLFTAKGWLQSDRAYLDNVCSCPLCIELVAKEGAEGAFAQYGITKPVTFKRGGSTVTMSYPTRETQVLATQHYMFCKEQEHELVAQEDLKALSDRLTATAGEVERVLGLDAVAHLYNWAEVITE